jgi:hypothetical protein
MLQKTEGYRYPNPDPQQKMKNLDPYPNPDPQQKMKNLDPYPILTRYRKLIRTRSKTLIPDPTKLLSLRPLQN